MNDRFNQDNTEIKIIEEAITNIFGDFNKTFEIDQIVILLIDILEKIKDENKYDALKDYLFIKNNQVNNLKKQTENNVVYNLGVYDLFSNIIFYLGENYKNSMENIYSKLSPKQKSIVNVIKKYDKVSIDLLKKELNISSQQLYNLTHTKEFENVVNIYRGISKKDIYYSVKYTTRQYLNNRVK